MDKMPCNKYLFRSSCWDRLYYTCTTKSVTIYVQTSSPELELYSGRGGWLWVLEVTDFIYEELNYIEVGDKRGQNKPWLVLQNTKLSIKPVLEYS